MWPEGFFAQEVITKTLYVWVINNSAVWLHENALTQLELHLYNAWQVHTIHAQKGAWLCATTTKLCNLSSIKLGTLQIALFQNQYYIQDLFEA